MNNQCFSPGQINGLTLKNRIIKAATYEGKTRDGAPTDELLQFHLPFAEGGVAMTTLAYCAAEANGRVAQDMMYMHEGIRPELSRIIKALQDAGTKVAGQLSHCGSFTKNKAFTGKRPLGPSKGLNTLALGMGKPFTQAMTHDDIRGRVAAFADAAAFMKSVGFDAIEIHFGHGYGISQFISPKTNKRQDQYGGSLENRMRLPLEILAAVRAAVGEHYPLLGKISMSDGVSGGVSYDESIEIAAMLDEGGIDAIICSGGTSSMNPMLMFRGDSLAAGLIENESNKLLKFGLKLIGSKLFKDYPYQDLYFFEQAKRIRERVKCKVIYIGGASSRENLDQLMAAGFDFVQLGRGLIYDPAFALHAEDDTNYKNGCTHCNRCATLIETDAGVRCVLHDSTH
jgi:2,4-dienoyl-CoA reductase-like NADH-dependent reductase (Old Yellow Enzyme family)